MFDYLADHYGEESFTQKDGTVVWRKARGPNKLKPVPAKLVKEVFARDGLKCRYCAWVHTSALNFHVEHVIPRVSGGQNELSNLVVACVSCNRFKKTRTWKPIPLAECRQIHKRLDHFQVLIRQGMEPTKARAVAKYWVGMQAKSRGIAKQKRNRKSLD